MPPKLSPWDTTLTTKKIQIKDNSLKGGKSNIFLIMNILLIYQILKIMEMQFIGQVRS